MRRIAYVRTEFHGEDEPVENDLLTFVYDYPHFGVCGIFPPLHIVNQILLSGGGDGGMSPGAVWKPFEITEKEYKELTEIIAATEPEAIKHLARYSDIKFKFDPDFDGVKDWLPWVEAVCEKHRKRHHE